MSKILVLDVETTGINVLKDDPIQIGYSVYEGREKTEEQEIFLKTEYLPPKITEITKITKSELDSKGISHIAAAKTWNDVMNRVDPDFLVGHNVIGFDLMLLNNWLLRTLIDEKYPVPGINAIHDTMMMARKYFNINKWLSLKEVARRLEIETDETRLHNALYDIEVTAKCYFVMESIYKQAEDTSNQQQFLF